MKLNARESILAWVTLVVAVLALTWWLGTARLQQWRELAAERDTLRRRRAVAEQFLARRATWNAQLDALRDTLPHYPKDRDVSAELLKMLERTSQEHGLVLTRREPEPERPVEDLYEVSINGTWEGSLDALVRFLYAIQSQGAMLDIKQLSVQPARGTPGRLKGAFALDCAYTREPTPATAPAGGGRGSS